MTEENSLEKQLWQVLDLQVPGLLFQHAKEKLIIRNLGLASNTQGAPKGKKLRAGLVGAGARGTGAAINFISSGPDLEIIALADVFQDKIDACRERFASFNLPIPAENCFTGFDGYKKLMALPDLDVVILATPPQFRPDHFLEAVIKEQACVSGKTCCS